MRCAVIGSPIAHSLSPAMHRAAYRELGLDWTYESVELGEDDLPTFLQALGDDVRGFSVTAPLKRVAAGLAPSLTRRAAMVGAANTLLVENGVVLEADNTDVPGFSWALAERGLAPGSARVVGGGATAASVAYALATGGTHTIELFVRDPRRAEATARIGRSAGADVTVRQLEEPLLDRVDLLVSTVPGAALGSRSHELVDSAHAVFDVVYDPWPTALAAAAAEAGVPVLSGLDLLAHQAALQVELMTGGTVRPQLLRKAALAALAAR